MKKGLLVLKTELNRALWNGGCVFAVIGVVMGILHGAKSEGMLTEMVRSDGAFLQCIQEALGSETMVFLLPILMCMPYSAIFVEEYVNGYLKFYLSRAGKKNYVIAKGIVSLLVPVIVSVVGILVAGISLKILFFQKVFVNGVIEVQRLIRSCGACMIACIIWSCLGTIYGIYFKSRHMAYAGTFITNYILVIIFGRYLKQYVFANPRNWNSGNFLIYMSGVALFLIVTEIVILKKEIEMH